MKKAASILITILTIGSIMLISSCSPTEEEPIPLKANAGADQTVAPLTTVTLDGSASTGPVGFTYQWIDNTANASLAIQNQNNAIATFVPEKNGIFTITLRIQSNGQFSEDQVIITVTGVLALPTTINTALVLKDIEPDPAKPDYTASGMVVIQTGANVTMPAQSNLVIDFAEAAGLEIQGGIVAFNTIKLTSSTGWKGILLSGGNLSILAGSQVVNAGKSTLTGQTETAAIVVTGGLLNMNASSFVSTAGTYDILSPGALTLTTSGISFSSKKPIKTSVANVSTLIGNFPTDYDYITLTTPGAGTQISSNSSSFQFINGYKYFIDGDFTSGSPIVFANPTIYMKAGTGILSSSGGISGNGTLDGLAGAAWKGIAVGAGSSISLNGITIKNAGSAVFNTGSFTSTQKAAVYYASITSSTGGIQNSSIIDSRGYGVYVDSPPGILVFCSNTVFTNPLSPAISIDVNLVQLAIPSATNTFTMPANVAAVEVRSTNPSTYQPSGTWQALGGSNFYLVTGNVFQTGGTWTLSPGLNMKFKSNKSLDIQGGTFKPIGTAVSPITFDSEAGTPGTWPGIVIESLYQMEYCQIKNGGESFLFKGGATPATEKANVVFNNTTNINNFFRNNTISGSGGYGILVEAGKQNPDAANVANNNTFSTNVSGNIIVK